MKQWLYRMYGSMELFRHAAIAIGGHRFYLFLLLAPMHLLGLWLLEFIGFVDSYDTSDVQGLFLGLPMTVVAIFLGLRVIAAEINARTLEIVYTVPGGCERVWWAKLGAGVFVLLPLEALLATGTWLFFSNFPPLVLVYAIQAPLFYMAVAMGFAALFRSEVGGAVVTFGLLVANGMVSGFGSNQLVVSPFFNPYAVTDTDTIELIGMILRNRIGFVLVIAAILALAFMRSNRREKLLSV